MAVYDARRTTADVDAVQAAYPEHVIPARTRFMLEEMFPRLERGLGCDPPGYGLEP